MTDNQLSDLNQLLKQLQYSQFQSNPCPICQENWIKYGHAENCELNRFIALTNPANKD